jgi:hypothetical protein
MELSTGLALAQVALSVVSSVLTAVVFCVIKFNDMKHLEAKIGELANDVKCGFQGITKDLLGYAERISTIEGYVNCKVSKKRKVKNLDNQG